MAADGMNRWCASGEKVPCWWMSSPPVHVGWHRFEVLAAVHREREALLRRVQPGDHALAVIRACEGNVRNLRSEDVTIGWPDAELAVVRVRRVGERVAGITAHGV